ncbi:hypothetical protein CARUB_v10007045mg [Capsella rubella]|uniref:Uncharacterized protein n=1 Tax=Capsella rubella TaxID=81985 RepID=R0GNS0_9BRAS|nr:hypothetical protein CARUB_v10007045mg [Capsella rubella]
MDLSTYYTTLRTLWNELDGSECVTLYRQIYNLLDQDHSQRSFTPAPYNSVAFQASMNATYNNVKPKVTCSHCGYIGHTVDMCYKIHGHPKNQPEKNTVLDKQTTPIKPIVAQLALTYTTTNNLINGLTKVLTKDHINGS